MDFYRRQEQARRASRWLVVAFAIAVTVVVLAVNAVVLLTLAVMNSDAPAFLTAGDWLGSHPGTVWLTTLVVVVTIAGSSLWKIAALRAGGKVVARDLGARPVTGEVADPLERRLLNVVEEMAIASSVPVPAVYLLEAPAINALAAGYAPSEASLVVTRGALLALDRDELQGVIGHEFSHILSGDMRLNTQLVGFLHGLFVVSELGRWLGPGERRTDGHWRRGGLLGWAGMALFVIGLFGLFVGRLLQAAVARQRERLADASAVQFTRQSLGLRNALVKVGAHRVGSRLAHYGIDRVSHMLFASAGRLDFATHPPLLERIRVLDPGFQSEEFGRMRHALDAREAGTVAREGGRPPKGALPQLFAADLPSDAAAIAGLVGNPGPLDVEFAEGLRETMPEDVRRAAAHPQAAEGLLLAIAVGPGDQDERLAFVRAQLGAGVADRVRGLLAVAGSLPPIQRLPAVLLAMGALRQSPLAGRERLVGVINGLITRGGTPTVFDYALRRSVMTFLRDGLRPAGPAWPLSIRGVRDDLRLVLGIVARSGAGDDATGLQASFAAGWSRLGLPPAQPSAATVLWTGPMDRALARLDRLVHTDKERVVQALTAAIAHDGVINVAEAELLRLFCAVLHCPLPPLLADLR